MAETFDRAAVEARLADAGRYALMDHETAQRFARAFHADLRATLAALDTATADLATNAALLARQTDLARQAEMDRDAATARVQALEAQVRKDHAECGCEDEPAARHCTRCGHWAPCCDMSVGQCPVHGEEQRAPVDESPCAVLTALALAPPPGEENG